MADDDAAGETATDAERHASSASADGAARRDLPPLGALTERSSYRWMVLAVILLGLASSNITLTILATATRFIASDLATTPAVLSWVVAAPFLFRAVFVPTFGKLGDRLGRRRTWVVGIALSTLFSLLCGFAWNGGSLVTFRGLSAVAAAAVVPTSLALIATEFPPAERVKAMGFFAATMAMSPLIGVIGGGFLVEAMGWRWLFYVQFPIGLTAFVLGYLLIRESRSEREEVFDYAGAAWSILALSGLMLALNQGPEWGWDSPVVLASILVTVVALPLFVRAELRASAPIVPVAYFRRARFNGALGAKFFAHFAYMGAFFLISLFFVDVLSYSPAEVSLAVSPRAASLAIMGPIAGFLGARFGPRLMGVSGMLCIVASMVALALLHAGSPYAAAVPGLVLAGFGLGLLTPSATATVTNEVGDDDLGVASGTVNLAGAIGASLGIATLFAITNVAAGDVSPPPAEAYRAALWTGAGMCTIGLIGAFYMGSTTSYDDDSTADAAVDAQQ